MDVLEGRWTAEAMLEIAEPTDGPSVERCRRLARELDAAERFRLMTAAEQEETVRGRQPPLPEPKLGMLPVA